MTTFETTDVALVGAGGQTGVAVTAALAARGLRVRAVVRSSAAGERALAAGAASVATADLKEPQTLREAFAGAVAVHMIPPLFDHDEVALVTHAVDAATAAGVQRFGFHSVLQSDEPGLPHHLRKNQAELVIRHAAIPSIVLRCGMYSQTPLRWLSSSLEGAPFGGDAPFTPIDLVDIAEITAIVLDGDTYTGGIYELAGHERLTYTEMAEIAGDRTHTQPVRPPAATLQEQSSWLTSWAAISDLAAMFAHYETGGLAGNDFIAATLLGRTPTSFADVVARTRNQTRP